MIRAEYKINTAESFTGYFRNMREMVTYENEVINDGDSLQRVRMEKVTIFDVHEDKNLSETEQLEIIFSMLYPEERLQKVDQIIGLMK